MSTATIDSKAGRKKVRYDLGVIPMSILEALLRSTKPLTAEELWARLRRDRHETTEIAVFRAINKLKDDGRIQYADLTMASAEAALANARRIGESLGADDAPTVKSVTRYEITDLGRAHVVGRLGITTAKGGISRTRWLLRVFERAMANLAPRHD
jgi:hypothetical protein